MQMPSKLKGVFFSDSDMGHAHSESHATVRHMFHVIDDTNMLMDEEITEHPAAMIIIHDSP